MGCDTTQQGFYKVQQRATIRRRELRQAWQQAWGAHGRGSMLQHNFCITGREVATRQAQTLRHGAPTRKCAKAQVRAVTQQREHATRPSMATTRPSARCDTALCVRPGRSARTACAQPGPWECALCTRPSFDSVHYSESLFGSLFMNIVHEHCSLGFQKNNFF